MVAALSRHTLIKEQTVIILQTVLQARRVVANQVNHHRHHSDQAKIDQ